MELEDKEERRDLLFQAIEEVLDEIIDERLKCSPFLPNEIDTIYCIGEEEMLQDVVKKWQ